MLFQVSLGNYLEAQRPVSAGAWSSRSAENLGCVPGTAHVLKSEPSISDGYGAWQVLDPARWRRRV